MVPYYVCMYIWTAWVTAVKYFTLWFHHIHLLIGEFDFKNVSKNTHYKVLFLNPMHVPFKILGTNKNEYVLNVNSIQFFKISFNLKCFIHKKYLSFIKLNCQLKYFSLRLVINYFWFTFTMKFCKICIFSNFNQLMIFKPECVESYFFPPVIFRWFIKKIGFFFLLVFNKLEIN